MNTMKVIQSSNTWCLKASFVRIDHQEKRKIQGNNNKG
jgi:hypothetical protein